MSSESTPPEAAPWNPELASLADARVWHGVERRVLLSKLQQLEKRAEHLRELEGRTRELAAQVHLLTHLAAATRAIHCAPNSDSLLSTALAHCLEVVEASKGSILLCDPQRGDLVVAKARGPHHASLEGLRVPLGQGVAGHVGAHRQPLHIDDLAADGRFVVRDGGRYATGSLCSVPVLAGERLLGVLNVSDRRDRRPFTGDDLRALVLLSQDLAGAIERLRRLETSEHEHQQLLAKLAHELRNPLDGVLRFINLTLGDQHPEERRRRYLVASRQGLERLRGILNSLTNFCRRGSDSDEPGGVNALVEQATALQDGKAEERHIEVELDLEADLPPVPRANALFEVFVNLTANAYDAMEDGGGTLAVTTRREGRGVVVRFADTGCGMSREVLEQVFTPFFTTKGEGRGMGIGLAVCRDIVRRIGGRIDATSEPGVGTTFTVAVPCLA